MVTNHRLFGHETRSAVRVSVDARVLLATEGRVALPASKVFHVPEGSFRFGVLSSEDELVASPASWDALDLFRVVSPAVDGVFVFVVDQVFQAILQRFKQII
jgi:hypothetical protein